MKLKEYEKIAMNFDELDRNTVCVNFDITDDYNIPTQQGGYVMVRRDYADNCFYITVIDADGEVASETTLPFKFNEVGVNS